MECSSISFSDTDYEKKDNQTTLLKYFNLHFIKIIGTGRNEPQTYKNNSRYGWRSAGAG
ncbi:MAG: hypothetical protein MIO93_05775 [ANME-2 cluster archaeon]|jgi:hypothetical protein|nr:hypothetical protein [ANME-2 cluster archaeon]